MDNLASHHVEDVRERIAGIGAVLLAGISVQNRRGLHAHYRSVKPSHSMIDDFVADSRTGPSHG